MEAAMATRPSLSHDRMSTAYHGPRSQSAGGHHPRTPRLEPSMENLAPILMPSGLNSMLKNTTETGDIGMFSIKPTRLPRLNGSATLSSLPKTAYHDLAAQSPDFSLFRVPPRMDDRRRLPSYNRDVTSEIASLHDSNSLKSAQSSSTGSRLFDESEQRSYSMTQTSLNVSRLANHRSYASLRSQGDMGLGQRPRSPFAYPSRLKRPGFRPSSPALTDGGIIDYSKRTEIGRESSVVSPASTSTTESQRRKPPPLAIRTDVNRSMPVHGGSVPPSPRQRGLQAPTGSISSRRSPSPSGNMPQSPLQREFHATRSPSAGHKSQAPSNRPAQSSAPSPSRSVVSNAPVVPSRLRSRASSSATSEKVPASPLYYDYTECFYPEEEGNVTPMEEFHSPPPIPQFMIDRTIHEDRELSSDWSYLAMTDLRGRGFLASDGLNLTPEEVPGNTDAHAVDFSYAGVTRSSSLQSVQVQSLYASDSASAEHSGTARVDGTGGISAGTGTIRQIPGYNGSGYGSGSTELTPDDEIGEPRGEVLYVVPDVTYSTPKAQTYLAQLPVVANSAAGTVYEDARSDSGSFYSDDPGINHIRLDSSGHAPGVEQGKRISQSVSVPAFRTTAPSDDGKLSTQIVGLALSTAEPSVARNDDKVDEDYFLASSDDQQNGTRRVVQTDIPISRRDSYQPDGGLKMDPQFKLNKYKSDSDLTTSKFGMRENNRYTIDGTRVNTIHTGPRNPREYRFSSSSEIMSPTPISPARELRVKNSIPQFMKALPPLPLRQPATERISLTDPRKSTSKRPPPLKLDPSTLAPSSMLSVVQTPVTPTLLAPGPAKNFPMVQKQFANSSQPFLSRWRLKARSPAVVPKPSPPASRPWNLEDSYPWNSEASAVEPLPAIVHKKSGLFGPKLRLKMMKSSDSLGGTVRVNRDAAQGTKDIPTLGPPKDLFSSPSAGLTNIFRQVSHHLQHNGEANSASGIPPHPEVLLAHEEAKAKRNHKVTKSASKSTMIQQENTSFSLRPSAQQTKSENGGTLPKLKQAVSRELRVATNIALRSSDHRGSLRQEGSQQELHDSIRKKLRARLPMSQSRAQSRKSEDIITRPKTAASSAPLIIAGFDGANDYTPPAAQGKKSSRLKKKVSSWFKGAKATVLGCVRHKHGTEASVDLGVAPLPEG